MERECCRFAWSTNLLQNTFERRYFIWLIALQLWTHFILLLGKKKNLLWFSIRMTSTTILIYLYFILPQHVATNFFLQSIFTFQLTLVSSIVVGSNFFSLRSRLFGHTGPQEIYSSLQDLITQQAARNAKNQQVSFTEQTPEVIAENNLRVGVWLFYKKKKKLLQKKN